MRNPENIDNKNPIYENCKTLYLVSVWHTYLCQTCNLQKYVHVCNTLPKLNVYKPLIGRGLAKKLASIRPPTKDFFRCKKVKKKWTSVPRDLKVFEPHGFV